jgi:hypothetical protein
MTGISPDVRAKVAAAAREKGRQAGVAFREHGTRPNLPPTDGGLIVQQYATDWFHGFEEGRASS